MERKEIFGKTQVGNTVSMQKLGFWSDDEDNIKLFNLSAKHYAWWKPLTEYLTEH